MRPSNDSGLTIDKRLCECGCGEWINSKDSQGRSRHFKHNHFFKSNKFVFLSEQYGHWKGGRVIDIYGYVWIQQKGHPKARKKGSYVKEHVLVMEKHLGRYLRDGKVVHHINGDKQDNRIQNLQLFNSQSEHVKKAHGKRNGRSLTVISTSVHS